MQIGKTYKDRTSSAKAVKVRYIFRDEVTGTRRAQVVWACNGRDPKRWDDRNIFEGLWKHYDEI